MNRRFLTDDELDRLDALVQPTSPADVRRLVAEVRRLRAEAHRMARMWDGEHNSPLAGRCPDGDDANCRYCTAEDAEKE